MKFQQCGPRSVYARLILHGHRQHEGSFCILDCVDQLPICDARRGDVSVNGKFGEVTAGSSAGKLLCEIPNQVCVAGLEEGKGYDYYRYVDDIRIIADSELHARRALQDLIRQLRTVGLNINANKGLYAAGDMYELFANTQLGLVDNRKAAKQLFLSYAYGMSRKALVDAAVSLGVDRQKAKEAFRLFPQYEEWKKSIWAEFQSTGRIATICGNHFRRSDGGQLTGKEQRSAVSQAVQGTASLIFKRALLAAAALSDVRVVLPMHDALLFEHRLGETPATVVNTFQDVMTDVLGGRVIGKASISDFAESVQSAFPPPSDGF